MNKIDLYLRLNVRRNKFNCGNYPWITIMKFKNSDDMET